MNTLVAAAGCCEEASPLSSKTYIPCNKPAVSLVHWPKRQEGPYRMCEMCAHHNVRNRGAEILGPFTPLTAAERGNIARASATSASPLPVPTFAELVAEHQKIKAWLEAEQERFNAHCKPWTDRMNAVKAECSAQMQASGAKSQRTEHGLAILSTLDKASIEPTERDDYLKMCLTNWKAFGGEMLQIGAPKAEAVRNYMDTHDGRLPPHVKITTVLQFSIRKA